MFCFACSIDAKLNCVFWRSVFSDLIFLTLSPLLKSGFPLFAAVAEEFKKQANGHSVCVCLTPEWRHKNVLKNAKKVQAGPEM